MRVKARNLGVVHRTTRRGFKRESKNSKTNGGHRWNANAMPGVCKNNVAPPAREPWGPLRRRQTLPLLRAAHFQCCLSHRIRAWFFWRCKKNIASCFIRRALGRLLHNIKKAHAKKAIDKTTRSLFFSSTAVRGATTLFLQTPVSGGRRTARGERYR